ncbi:MAG TPA: PQQ-binding-like beta-propeller repeat protein [Bacteroidia bacterium]|nr:PQQ-binding-like beta-propeller repeat protein [Bacteroidia bacterium]
MRRLAIALLVLAAFVPSEAQEWTRFRGPDGTGLGRMTGLKSQLSEADYAWSVKLDGIGHSSPVLWGEKLFLTLAAADGTQRRVECYDAASGAKLWTWEAPLETLHLHKFNTFASASPTVDADQVYVAWASGTRTEAVALDHAGKVVWQRDWPEFTSDHGFGASPILVEGTLVLHTDSVEKKKSLVIGLDPATGKSLWEVERVTEGAEEKHLTAYNTPVAMTIEGRTMVVVLQTNDGWKGLDPKTGEVLWGFDGEYTQRSVGSIASGGGPVFASFGSGSQGSQATALRPKAHGDPEVAYSLGKADGLGYVPTPLFYEGRLYLMVDSGILTCLDAATGKRIYRERVGGNFFASPIVADGKILALSREGELVALKPGDTFEILGRSKFGDGASATPAVANNRLYLRTDTDLICVPGS